MTRDRSRQGAVLRRNRVFALAAALVVCALAALAVGGCSPVFTVNGKGVDGGAYEKEVERRLEAVRKRNAKELAGARGEKLVKETERQVATEMIRAEIMQQKADELGVLLAADEAGKALEQKRAELGFDAFQKLLKEQGVTEEEYLSRLKDQLLVEALGKKVTADVAVTEDEAESFYLMNKGLFSQQVMLHLAHIVLDNEGQAEMVWNELKDGGDFSTLASQVSKDEATRNNGGDMGWIESGTVDPAIEQVAFGLSSGQTSGVIKTSDGFQITKILERREAYTPPFSEVKTQAEEVLLNRKKEEKFSDWLRTAYANARVEVPGGLGHWDPRLGTVVD